ncbi:MAG: hypothetical protein H6Q73_1621 [Firmicutes bacterium]|nr:hypothetical protein [Bacillota bacterium]
MDKSSRDDYTDKKNKSSAASASQQKDANKNAKSK